MKEAILLLAINVICITASCQNKTFIIVEKDSTGVNKYKELEFPTDECPDGGYYPTDIDVHKDSLIVYEKRMTGSFMLGQIPERKKCIYKYLNGNFVKTKEYKSIYTPEVKIEKTAFFTYEDGTVQAVNTPQITNYMNPILQFQSTK